jgi:hypothetical protein
MHENTNDIISLGVFDLSYYNLSSKEVYINDVYQRKYKELKRVLQEDHYQNIVAKDLL